MDGAPLSADTSNTRETFAILLDNGRPSPKHEPIPCESTAIARARQAPADDPHDSVVGARLVRAADPSCNGVITPARMRRALVAEGAEKRSDKALNKWLEYLKFNSCLHLSHNSIRITPNSIIFHIAADPFRSSHNGFPACIVSQTSTSRDEYSSEQFPTLNRVAFSRRLPRRWASVPTRRTKRGTWRLR